MRVDLQRQYIQQMTFEYHLGLKNVWHAKTAVKRELLMYRA